jgi:hypothetical protein
MALMHFAPKGRAARVITCLLGSFVAGVIGEPTVTSEVATPRVESRARESLQVQLDAKKTWAAVIQTVDDSQGKVLVAREELGFISFYYDLATKLFPTSFVNANLLVRRLITDQEPALKLLRERLSPEAQDQLSKHHPETYPSECLLNILADDLNRVIGGEARSPEKSSALTPLSASALLSQSLMNRRWLETTLPDVIRSWPGDLNGPRRIVVCNILVVPSGDGDKQVSWVYFSSWQEGAPTALSYGNVFFGSMERLLKGKKCAPES